MRGMPGIKVPLPVVIGLDMAGEIAEVGAGVQRLEGRRPRAGQSGQQEERPDGRDAGRRHGGILPRRAPTSWSRMPAGVSFEDAASLPVAYGTAHRMLITHDTIESRRQSAGARRLAAASAPAACCWRRCSAPRSSPAPRAPKSSSGSRSSAPTMASITPRPTGRNGRSRAYGKPQRRSYDGGVDVVINFTGGDTWLPSLRCLKRGGKLLVCGATAGYDPKEDLRYVWSFELKIIGSNSFYDDDLAALMDLIAARQDEAGDRQGAAARTGARRLAADRRTARSSAKSW